VNTETPVGTRTVEATKGANCRRPFRCCRRRNNERSPCWLFVSTITAYLVFILPHQHIEPLL